MSHFTFVIMPKALDAMSSGSWLGRKRWPFIPTHLSKGAERDARHTHTHTRTPTQTAVVS